MTDRLRAFAEFGQELSAWACEMNLLTLAVFLVALVADLTLARRLSAAWRIALYLPVFLRVIIPADAAWHVPFWEQHAPRTTPFFTQNDPIAATLARPAPRAAPAEPSLLPSLWIALYVSGVLLLGCHWAGSRQRVRAVLAAAQPHSSDPSVLVSPLAGPMVAGLWRPRVVIPEWLGRSEALPLVLAHERAHIDRGDPALAFSLRLMCTLAWPVLPLWFTASRVRSLMEQACDDRALGIPEDRTADRVLRYADAMIDVANRSLRMPASLTFGTSLASRVRALRVSRRWPLALQVLPSLTVPLLLIACSTAQPQRHQAQGPKTIAPFLPDSEVRIVNVRVLNGDVPVRGLDAVEVGPGQFAADRGALLERVGALPPSRTQTSPRLAVNLGQEASIRTESQGRAIEIQIVVHPSAPGTAHATLSYTEANAYSLPSAPLKLEHDQAWLLRIPSAEAGGPPRTLIVTIDRPGQAPSAGC